MRNNHEKFWNFQQRDFETIRRATMIWYMRGISYSSKTHKADYMIVSRAAFIPHTFKPIAFNNDAWIHRILLLLFYVCCLVRIIFWNQQVVVIVVLLFCANEKGVIVLKLCIAENYRILHADDFPITLMLLLFNEWIKSVSTIVCTSYKRKSGIFLFRCN